MTHTAYWYRYPNGKTNEPLECDWKEFDNLDKAVQFVKRKYQKTRWMHFAGAHVEDETGEWLFEIADNGTETWAKEITAGQATGR